MLDSKNTKVVIGFALLPVAVWLLGWAPVGLLLFVALVLAAGLGSFELAAMLFRENGAFEKFLVVLMSLLMCLATQEGEAELMVLGLSVVFIVSAGVLLFKEKDLARVLPNAGLILVSSVYVGMFTGLIVALRRLEPGVGGSHLVLMLFALAWANDAGAFFVGSRWGETKLWPAVSAGKTWAGFYGGIAASILMGIIIAAWSPVWRLGDGLALGVLFAFATPLGDLVESAVKRGAGVKDSGRFLPGHGGVLDRIDSILYTAPILYFYALIVGPGRLAG